MDAVGFASSVIALAETASTIYKYVKDVKDGPRDRAELQRSLAGLPGLLKSLEAQFESSDPNDAWSTETLKLAATDGPFAQLLVILQKVEKKLDLAANLVGKVIQKLKWPLDKAEVTDLLQQIERVKSFIMLALQNDHFALSRAIHHKVAELADGAKQIQAHNINADLRAFSEWLSPIDFQAIQQNHLEKRVPGTGHWLPEEVKFQQWTAGEIKILWCPGNPGVGKTILASTAVDHLRNQLSHPGVAVACIFFDYNTSSPQSITDFFGSVIRQLLIDSSSIPDSLQLLHTSFQSRHSRPTSLRVMAETLRAQIQLYSCVYLVVDALDECPVDIRDDFISTIRSLTESGPLSVLITSRDILTIAQEFTNETRIDVRAHDDDVLSYITYRIEQDKKLKRIVKEDAVLKKDIVTQVTEKAAGMFLLVRLHLDSLASKNNRQVLRQALATLPKDIHRSYDETMARIMAQGEDDANLACQVFLWLTYSQKRLTVEELQCAVAISPGMTVMDPDVITDIDILMSVCTGLVIIEDHWTGQRPRFVHYTTQEYFEHQENQKYFRIKETEAYFELLGKTLFSDLFAHFHIVATCITHLAFESPEAGQYDKFPIFRLSNYPLLPYAKGFWGYHAGQCENMLCSSLRMAALLQKHLEASYNVPSPSTSTIEGFEWFDLDYHSGHVLGSFGLLQLTSMLFDCGVLIKDQEKRAVLFHAVQNGHVDMVKWLLEAVGEINLPGQQLFNVNDADHCGSTLLHHAINVQRPAMAEFLLGLPGIHADVANNCGRTPLSYAAESSCPQIVDLICQQENVNPNSHDEHGSSPLYYAIQRNHMENVRILLRHPNIDVKPLQSSSCWPFRILQHPPWGYLDSPLKFAVQQGYVDIVDLLLKHPDTDPNWKGVDYTPLAYAILRGHLEVVNLLLQQSDIQPNLMSGPPYYQWVVPPLSYAVRERTMGIVKQLLQHPDLDVNCRDFNGLTSLSWAVLIDYEDGVEFLLQHPHIQPDIPHEMGGTPLMMAAMKARESLFHVLFQSHRVTRESVSVDNVGLLAYAAYGGNRNIIHWVLDDLSFSGSCRDCHLCTPLSYAAMEGYQDVVQLLLQHDVFVASIYLDMEHWYNNPTVSHLLLPDQKNLDLNSRHHQHFITLIDYALRWGYTGIAALLRQHVDTEDSLAVDGWN